jgi:hypothetical protein
MKMIPFRWFVVAAALLISIAGTQFALAHDRDSAWNRYLFIRAHLEQEGEFAAARWDGWRAKHGNGPYILAAYTGGVANAAFRPATFRPAAYDARKSVYRPVGYGPVYRDYNYGHVGHYGCYSSGYFGQVHAGPAHVYYGPHGSVHVGPVHVRW